MKRIVVPIKGMHCRSCELLLEDKIGQVQGVRDVKVDHRKGEAVVAHGADLPSQDEIARAVRDAGYEIGRGDRAPWLSNDYLDYRNLGLAALIVGVLYLAYRSLGAAGFNVDTKNVTLAMALVVGLIAGVSSCMALVGGLVMGIAARHAELHPEATAWQKFRPHLYFNVGRVTGYAFFGGLLGLVGGVIKPSTGFLALLTIAVGVVMLVMGLKLTGLSPRLKDGGLTLPASIGRWLGLNRHQGEYGHGRSLVTGALTFFLPCGFTQSMQIFAVSTGSFGRGAAVMAMFALGTAPALLGVGGLTSVIKGAKARLFYSVIGLAVVIFGVLNVSNGLALAGFDPGAAQLKRPAVTADVEDGVQVVRMTQTDGGYSPNVFTVKKGVPVKWIITSTAAYSCAASISMPAYQIFQRLEKGENVIEFTPQETGTIPFSCSMGMYRGAFNVVDGTAGGAPSAPSASIPTASASGSCGVGGGGCGCGGSAPKKVVPGNTQAGSDVQKLFSRDNYGLSPNEFTVKAGQPVEWTIQANNPPSGCVTGYRNDKLGVYVYDAYPDPTVIKFTPTARGDYNFTCPMGMAWRGVIHVQ